MGALREGWEEVSVEGITLTVDGLEVPAVHARPDGMPKAGLVLAPDVGGLRPLFEDLCRRLATNGIAVVAVDPFPRFTPEERAMLTVPERLERVKELDDHEQLGALSAAADFLVVSDDALEASILGFCMGGYYTFKAAVSERFERAVVFYGNVHTPGRWQGPGHGDPLATVGRACPTLAVFGGADALVPIEHVEELRHAWRDRADCEIVVVDGAEHGFVHDPERPAHRDADANALWERALAWIMR